MGVCTHLGVELHAVEAARARLHGRDGRSRAGGQHLEAGRRLGDAVAVAHPALLLAAQPLEEQARLEHVERRLAELAEVGARHRAAEVQGQALHAVADAEHRDAELEDLGVELRGVVDVDAHGAAGEDDALGRVRLDALDGRVVRDELRVHAALAHAARDELPVLRPEVEHEDGVEPLHLRRALRHGASLSLISDASPVAGGGPQPMPTSCSFCSFLPSVISDGATMTSAFWNELERLVAAGRHAGAQRAEQVERAVVLVRRAEEDLLEGALDPGLHARAARQLGVEGGHAPVIAAAGRFAGRGQRRADHDGVGAEGDGLADVAAGAHAAVGDDVAVLARLEHVLHARRRGVGDGRGLRHADAEHAARGAGVARADADEHAHGAGAHEVQRGRVAGHAADDHRHRALGDELLAGRAARPWC